MDEQMGQSGAHAARETEEKSSRCQSLGNIVRVSTDINEFLEDSNVQQEQEQQEQFVSQTGSSLAMTTVAREMVENA